jgi:pimeloyl-ACP methyl ester carboxylesterase
VNTNASKHGTEIYFKDRGKRPIVTLFDGWPLNSDAWNGQMPDLTEGHRKFDLPTLVLHGENDQIVRCTTSQGNPRGSSIRSTERPSRLSAP